MEKRELSATCNGRTESIQHQWPTMCKFALFLFLFLFLRLAEVKLCMNFGQNNLKVDNFE